MRSSIHFHTPSAFRYLPSEFLNTFSSSTKCSLCCSVGKYLHTRGESNKARIKAWQYLAATQVPAAVSLDMTRLQIGGSTAQGIVSQHGNKAREAHAVSFALEACFRVALTAFRHITLTVVSSGWQGHRFPNSVSNDDCDRYCIRQTHNGLQIADLEPYCGTHTGQECCLSGMMPRLARGEAIEHAC